MKNLILGIMVAAFANIAVAAEVNVYSSRKEILTKDLFDEFTRDTGIKVNFIKDKAGKLISRLQSEGKNTPADVFMTADVANLFQAKSYDLLSKVESDELNKNIPIQYRDLDNQWFGLTMRVRAIFYAKDRVKPEELSTYEALADEKWKNKILIRSSSNVYNQSLVASIILSHGYVATSEWMEKFVSNFARKPQGGDRDQIRAVAAGEGDIAIGNSYYYGRMQTSNKQADLDAASKVGIFFPNQEGNGAHVNISGGGVTKHAKNRDNAIALLEFLVSEKAQKIYAERNHEFPVRAGVKESEVAKAWGKFKSDPRPLSQIVKYNNDASKMADEVSWR